jgi:hypothetical protein
MYLYRSQIIKGYLKKRGNQPDQLSGEPQWRATLPAAFQAAMPSADFNNSHGNPVYRAVTWIPNCVSVTSSPVFPTCARFPWEAPTYVLAPSSVVDWGTMLQTAKPWVRFAMSLDIYFFNLPNPSVHTVDSGTTEPPTEWVPGTFIWGGGAVKRGRSVTLTTSPPSMSLLHRKCGMWKCSYDPMGLHACYRNIFIFLLNIIF